MRRLGQTLIRRLSTSFLLGYSGVALVNQRMNLRGTDLVLLGCGHTGMVYRIVEEVLIRCFGLFVVS